MIDDERRKVYYSNKIKMVAYTIRKITKEKK